MSETDKQTSGERLAKVMARAGVCSRRDAEAWIMAGRVSVNGARVRTPAFNVSETDTVAVDGKEIARRQPTQAWIYHKPAGLMVTEKDPEGRPTVFEKFTELGLPRVMTIGRLDYSTEGLLLLTNDGGLKRTLELPSTGWVRRYRVRAFGKVTQAQLDTLAEGMTVEGVNYGPIEATLDSETGSNVWMTLALREGKNREVRNVLGALGLEVNRLIRLSYGPFQLGELPVGAVEKIKTRILRDQLGKRLAGEAGADFSREDPDAGAPRRRTPDKPAPTPFERDRFGGVRRRPERAGPPDKARRERRVHFDDRPSETIVTHERSRDRDRDGDRPDRPGKPGGFKARGGDRPDGRRGGENRGPRRDRDDQTRGDRPFGKSEGKRPASRPGGSRPLGKPERERGPASERGYRDDAAPRRSDGKPGGARPGGKPAGSKSFGGKGRPAGGRPTGDKADAGKAFGDKPRGRKPVGGKPSGGRPDGGKGYGGKPGAGRPGAPKGRGPGGAPPRDRKPRGR